MYRLGKMYKETLNGLPPFHPVFSGTGTPIDNLAKFLLQSLTHSEANEYTAIESSHFSEELCQQDHNLHTASLDVNSLFTIIAKMQTICNLVG